MTLDSHEKKVDESWKEQVEKDRRQPQKPQPSSAAQPKKAGQASSDLSMFLSSLSMQAMVALGEMAHPGTGLSTPDPEQARYLIDVLGLLQEKTRGNLTPEEAALLDGLLYELRMKYVERTRGGAAQ